MTARLLPSPNALHIARSQSELELAAHDVIWHLFRVVDALTQQAYAITLADVDEARARLNDELLHFNALADKARIVKADDEYVDALEALAGA